MDRKNNRNDFLIRLIGAFLYLVLSQVGLIVVFRNDFLNGFYQPWKFYAVVIAVVLSNVLVAQDIYKHYKKELKENQKS